MQLLESGDERSHSGWMGRPGSVGSRVCHSRDFEDRQRWKIVTLTRVRVWMCSQSRGLEEVRIFRLVD